MRISDSRWLYMVCVATLSSSSVFAANPGTSSEIVAPDSPAIAGLVGQPVGLIRLTIPPDSTVPISLPLESFDPTIAGIFQDQLTAGDEVLVWQSQQQQYQVLTRLADGSWTMPSEEVECRFAPGQGFWVRNNGTIEETIYLTGRIPLDSPEHCIFYPGYNAFGYPFTATKSLSDIDLDQSGARAGESSVDADSIVSVRDQTGYWLQKGSPNAQWVANDDISTDGVLEIGQAYWYCRYASEPLQWLEASPYEGAFSSDPATPQIEGLRVDSETEKVVLTILADPQSVHGVDIYYQDVVPGQEFDPLYGWLVAASGVAVSTAQGIEWTDIESGQRPPMTALFARFYLVTTTGMNLDATLRQESIQQKASTTSTRSPSTLVRQSSRIAIRSGSVIYSDIGSGDNDLDGLAAEIGDGHGPKKDITAGLAATADGDVVQVASGTYTNEQLWSLGSRSLVIRPTGCAIIR